MASIWYWKATADLGNIRVEPTIYREVLIQFEDRVAEWTTGRISNDQLHSAIDDLPSDRGFLAGLIMSRLTNLSNDDIWKLKDEHILEINIAKKVAKPDSPFC